MEGGYPIPGSGGGTPSSWWGVPNPRDRWGWEYPIQLGGTPSQFQVGGGYSIPGPDMGSTPSQVQGGTPSQVWMGYSLSRTVRGTLPHSGLDEVPPPPPPSRTGWGTPPPLSGDSSIASTCYMAGGMPLAFTQEDFLVLTVSFSIFTGTNLKAPCWNVTKFCLSEKSDQQI